MTVLCRRQTCAYLGAVSGLLSVSGALASDGKAVDANKLLNVSGMTPASAAGDPESSLLIAHDNKGKMVYTAKLTMTPTGGMECEPLDWDTWETQPFDLEGLCRVPGTDTFIALPSKATVAYQIKIVPTDWGWRGNQVDQGIQHAETSVSGKLAADQSSAIPGSQGGGHSRPGSQRRLGVRN